jgi:hypothetical protein
MTALQVDFPEPWAVLPSGARGVTAVETLAPELAELGPEAQEAVVRQLTTLARGLDDLEIDGLASLVITDEESQTLVQAVCAMAVLATDEKLTPEEVRRIAEAGPHPGGERQTTSVQLPAGPAVRSAAVRHAAELIDADGLAPFAAEVRYVVPVAEGRVGVLHFETLSLVYLEELTELFDAVAGTARLG